MVSRMDTATIGIMPEVQRVPCDNPAIMELRNSLNAIHNMLDERHYALSERINEIEERLNPYELQALRERTTIIEDRLSTIEGILNIHHSIIYDTTSDFAPPASPPSGVLDSGSELERYLDGIPVVGRK